MSESRLLLIVEDDPALQKQMRWAFDACETVVADDRASAIAQLRPELPQVGCFDTAFHHGLSADAARLRRTNVLRPHRATG